MNSIVVNGIAFEIHQTDVNIGQGGFSKQIHGVTRCGQAAISIKSSAQWMDEVFNEGKNYDPARQKEPHVGQLVRYSNDLWRMVYKSAGNPGSVRLNGGFVLRNVQNPKIERFICNPMFMGAPVEMTPEQQRLIDMANELKGAGLISEGRAEVIVTKIKSKG